MKKLLALALVCLLTLTLTAYAATNDAALLRRGDANAYEGDLRGLAAAADGTLYILAGDALYTLAAGESAPARQMLALEEETLEAGVTRRYEAVALVSLPERPALLAAEIVREDFGDGEPLETVEAVRLHELSPDGMGEEICELDWYDLLRADESGERLPEVSLPVVAGDALCFRSEQSGAEIVAVTDLNSGDTEAYYIDELADGATLEGLCTYKDGTALVLTVQWGETQNACALHAFDPAEGTFEPLATFSCPSSACPAGPAYDAASDTLYLALSGELQALPGLDPAQMHPVAAMPLERMNDVSPVLLNGAYIAGNGDAVVRRATDPAQRAQTRLIIQNGYTASLENAYYDFMAARGDVEATLTDFGGDLVQSLLGKSQEVDIYCADAQLPAYEAALSRGYLPAIEDEAVQAFVDRCYPFVREVCMRDGEAVAVPTGMVLRTRLGCNEELLGALGMAREELPATWPDFFASLEGLSRRVEAIPGATLFESGEDRESLRQALLTALLDDCVAAFARPENGYAFDASALRAALAAFEAVPWEAFVPETGDGEGETPSNGEMSMSAASAAVSAPENTALFSLNVDGGAREGASGGFALLPLAIAEGEEALVLAEVSVAFVNPYAQHPEEAEDFLATLVSSMDGVLKLQLAPGGAPLARADYEARLAAYDERLAALRAQGEEAQAAYIACEAEREQYASSGGWLASEASLARYRALAETIAPARDLGLASGEAAWYARVQQYLDGAITADAFVAELESSLQMMAQEGY